MDRSPAFMGTSTDIIIAIRIWLTRASLVVIHNVLVYRLSPDHYYSQHHSNSVGRRECLFCCVAGRGDVIIDSGISSLTGNLGGESEGGVLQVPPLSSALSSNKGTNSICLFIARSRTYIKKASQKNKDTVAKWQLLWIMWRPLHSLI